MGKKNKKKKNKKEPAWKSYLKAESGKAWKSKKDQKRADKHWNNSAMRQRRPAAAAAHDARSKAYSDQRASNNNNKKKNRSSAPAPTKAPRDTGKYEDIRAAQSEDRAAGQQAAQDFQNRSPQVSNGISPEIQAQLDALGLANGNLNNQLAQAQNDYASQLQATSDAYQQRLDQAAKESAAAMQRMEQMMLQQQQQAQATQQLLQGQLTSTQNALQSQQRMSANLANAYVPQAEASAQSVTYGDQRRQRRRQRDNSLSDLSIVSGVDGGGSGASLSGLQLAG